MGKIILENVRGSYVYIDQPRPQRRGRSSDDGEKSKYGMQVIIPKSDKKLIRKLKAEIDKVLEEKFGAAALKRRGRYKLPLRDGDEEREEKHFRKTYFCNANTTRKPGVVNRQGETADEDDMEDYGFSGCYFNVSVNVYGYDGQDGGKPGVSLWLNNVMLRKKGPRLDGRIAASEEFADYADDEDYEDDDLDGDDLDDDDDLDADDDLDLDEDDDEDEPPRRKRSGKGNKRRRR